MRKKSLLKIPRGKKIHCKARLCTLEEEDRGRCCYFAFYCVAKRVQERKGATFSLQEEEGAVV